MGRDSPAVVEHLAARIAGAFVFLAVVGGSTFAAYDHLGVAELAFDAAAVDLLLGGDVRVAPGRSAALPFVVRNAGDAPQDLAFTVEGAGVGTELLGAPSRLAPHAEGAGFLVVQVPSRAEPGVSTIVLMVASPDGARIGSARLTVDTRMPGGPGAGDGDTVLVDYIGFFSSGEVFDTSVEGVATSPVAKASTFREHAYSPLPAALGAQARTIEGFWRGLVGMHEGESRLIVVAPEDGYGAAEITEIIERASARERDLTIGSVFQGPRATYSYLLEEDTKVGDVVFCCPNAAETELPLRVEELNSSFVRLALDVELGDRFTLYPFWPKASAVSEIGERTVTFTTTPSEEGGPITFFEHWPNMTHIAGVNDTEINLRHDPPVGYEYERRLSPQQVRHERVTALDEDSVTVAYENPHPLGGKTLYFAVKAVGMEHGTAGSGSGGHPHGG